ncbi:MAG: bifunctional folylpolyglutamate synthase/dihydrofolate synthase [Gemmatimonadetes bacterium]|nr:bifunctional folylpolyglutamate synthase/dihydrofolate synthase [Gemmatimonadota bacterium]
MSGEGGPSLPLAAAPGAATLASPDRLDRPFTDPLVQRLFPPLPTGVHWGLERTFGALADLGDPHLAVPVLHVGGTNGKGSVASILSAVLGEGGLRVGLYTSPHLVSFRERYQVSGRPMSDEALSARASEIRDALERHGLTFFEAATVLGFHAFARAGLDVLVAEVGLGGRLDATNVVRPLAAAITNVAMDHADFLGDTLEAIAREKAGIAKPGVPLVTAETDPALLTVLERASAARGAPFTAVHPERHLHDVEVARDHTGFTLDTRAWGRLRLTTPLVGRHQAVNAALAVEVLEHLPPALRPDADALRRGMASVRWPGRDQIEVVEGTTWLLDVAHNTAGIGSLVDVLDRVALPRPRTALVGVLGDKDWRSMLPPLLRRMDRAVLTQPPTAPPERRWDPSEAAAAVAGMEGVPPLVLELDFERAFSAAAEPAGGTVVVTGSVHTVGGALRLLGKEPFPQG